MKPNIFPGFSPDDPTIILFPLLRKLTVNIKPRRPQDVCLLCLKNAASKTASHIFPDFFTKSIFKDLSKRRFFITDGLDVKKASSSTPKEAYLLCNSCEIKLGALERAVSNGLFHDLKKMRQASKLSENDFNFKLKSVHPALFHLFVYSMLWRAEVCHQAEFTSLLVSQEHTEILRNILDTCLSTKVKVMILAFQGVCPGSLPIKYHALTYFKEPKRQHRMIFGVGHDYLSKVGYRLFINEINILFLDTHYYSQNAFTYTEELSAVSPRIWEAIAGDTLRQMIEMNRHMRNENK